LNYRKDHRSEKEFEQDIRVAHQKELEIALRICQFIYDKNGYWPHMVPYGTDFTGSLIKDNSLVTSEPDFLINGEMYEITRSDTVCKKHFHEKINKVKKCIENNYNMVFVNGLEETDNPSFLILDKTVLEILTDVSVCTYGEVGCPTKSGKMVNKPCYRYNVEWCRGLWKKLPKIDKIPPVYAKIVKAFEDAAKKGTESKEPSSVKNNDAEQKSGKRNNNLAAGSMGGGQGKKASGGRKSH
jgi:hypothetical protein